MISFWHDLSYLDFSNSIIIYLCEDPRIKFSMERVNILFCLSGVYETSVLFRIYKWILSLFILSFRIRSFLTESSARVVSSAKLIFFCRWNCCSWKYFSVLSFWKKNDGYQELKIIKHVIVDTCIF